jgi:hypothetical protein
MTYDKAVNVLVDAGLIKTEDVPAAIEVLETPAVEFTYPDWAQALANAGFLDEANVAAAADLMQKAGEAEAKDDPEAFKQGLENAGIL